MVRQRRPFCCAKGDERSDQSRATQQMRQLAHRPIISLPAASTPRRDLKLKQRYPLQHAHVPFAGFRAAKNRFSKQSDMGGGDRFWQSRNRLRESRRHGVDRFGRECCVGKIFHCSKANVRVRRAPLRGFAYETRCPLRSSRIEARSHEVTQGLAKAVDRCKIATVFSCTLSLYGSTRSRLRADCRRHHDG